jgi:hypothetical protein
MKVIHCCPGVGVGARVGDWQPAANQKDTHRKSIGRKMDLGRISLPSVSGLVLEDWLPNPNENLI